jgi:hypothetical protein
MNIVQGAFGIVRLIDDPSGCCEYAVCVKDESRISDKRISRFIWRPLWTVWRRSLPIAFTIRTRIILAWSALRSVFALFQLWPLRLFLPYRRNADRPRRIDFQRASVIGDRFCHLSGSRASKIQRLSVCQADRYQSQTQNNPTPNNFHNFSEPFQP